MIAAIILLIHIGAVVYAFLKYRKEGIGEGFLASAFVVIIFSVGWTVATMVAKVIYPADLVAQWVARVQDARLSRIAAKELTIDTLSLVLLTMGEAVFYYFFLKSGDKARKPKDEAE